MIVCTLSQPPKPNETPYSKAFRHRYEGHKSLASLRSKLNWIACWQYDWFTPIYTRFETKPFFRLVLSDNISLKAKKLSNRFLCNTHLLSDVFDKSTSGNISRQNSANFILKLTNIFLHGTINNPSNVEPGLNARTIYYGKNASHYFENPLS